MATWLLLFSLGTVNIEATLSVCLCMSSTKFRGPSGTDLFQFKIMCHFSCNPNNYMTLMGDSVVSQQ